VTANSTLHTSPTPSRDILPGGTPVRCFSANNFNSEVPLRANASRLQTHQLKRTRWNCVSLRHRTMPPDKMLQAAGKDSVCQREPSKQQQKGKNESIST